MNIEKLRYALEIERCGTINKAALNLFVSQPHLSKSLKTLEESFGITIFHRTKQGVMLTNEGREFLQYARAIVTQMDIMTEKYDARKAIGPHLKISCVRSSNFMEGFVQFMDLYRKSESIHATFKETGLFEVLDDVKNGTSGLGFIMVSLKEHAFFQNIIRANQLEYTKISNFKAHVVMSELNKQAKESQIDLARLKQFTYVAYGEFENTLLNIDNEHQMVNLEPPEKIVVVHDRGTLFEFLARKEYYTISHKILPYIAARYGLSSIMPGETLHDAEVGYVKVPLKILTTEEEKLIDIIRQLYQEQKFPIDQSSATAI